MTCTKCQKPLLLCECPDMGKRIEAMFASPRLYFPEEVKAALRKQAARNQEEKTTTE